MQCFRRIPALVVSILVVLGCAPAAEIGPNLEEIEAAVRARSAEVAGLEAAGDYQSAITYFADDVIVQIADAPHFQGREPLLEIYETVFASTVDFEGTTTDVVAASSADLAYEYGINRFVFETPDGPLEVMGKYLGVWKKIEGEWYIVAIAASNDAPPPT
jgi:ketosteroid isomerase-like protein